MISSATHLHGKPLDLIITSHPSNILDINIREPFAGSCDHNMIEINLNLFCSKSNALNIIEQRDFYKGSYDLINKFLSRQSWHQIITEGSDIDIIYSKFTAVIHKSIEKFIPLRKLNKKPKLPKNVKQLLKEKKKTYKLLKTRPDLIETYKCLEKSYKKSVKLHFRQVENHILSSSNKNLFFSYTKKKLKIPSDLPPLLNNNGDLILDPLDKANLLNSHFGKIFEKDQDNINVNLNPLSHRFDVMNNIKITTDDVKNAILRLKNSVARSPDSIPSFYLRKTVTTLATPLSLLYNISLNTGKLPIIWKIANIKPTFKKGQKNSPANWRPISLTCPACRGMESVINEKMTQYIIKNKLFSTIQHGFISNRSTQTQHLKFFNDLTQILNKKTNCDVIYIDFSKAFDKISHRKLILVLHHYKINPQIIAWITDFLHQRTQRTVVENKFSSVCAVTSGVPQGTVLAPKLFNLYLESLILNIDKKCEQTKVYAFADDLKILSSNPQDLQIALNTIESWSSNWNLQIQPSKSEHIFFPYSRNSSSSLNTFYINQAPIPKSENVKDLGLILSNNLKWSNYISSITTKANMTAHTILRSFQTNNIKLIINLFNMYVRPTLEYNTCIWNPNLTKDINSVESVQRKFTKRLCQRNNIKFNSYNDRLKILKMETLETRRYKRDVIIMFKIYHNLIDIDFNEFFTSTTSSYNLRGHSYQLNIPKHSSFTPRQNFFSNRILTIWNKLPEDLLNAQNLGIFKSKLNKLDLTQFYNNTF